MKHLGNCTYDEFLAQAVKIKEPLATWLKETGAAEIRKKAMSDLPADHTQEQLAACINSFLAMMELAAFRKCPELTHEVLSIATFSEYDDKRKGEYIDAAFEMYADRVVRDFFTLSLRPSMMTSTGQ